MGRNKKYDESLFLSQVQELFASRGYHGTSIDDIVKSTGILRGSLYQAYGSKLNLFILAFQSICSNFQPTAQSLDLLIVALKELAHENTQVSTICSSLINDVNLPIASLLSEHLLSKLEGYPWHN